MLKGFFYNQSMLIAQDVDSDGTDIWTPDPFLPPIPSQLVIQMG